MENVFMKYVPGLSCMEHEIFLIHVTAFSVLLLTVCKTRKFFVFIICILVFSYKVLCHLLRALLLSELLQVLSLNNTVSCPHLLPTRL